MPDTKAKLLIVDDEPSIRTSLSMVLSEIGYCVRTAGDGLEALAQLRNDIPDILVSDLNMPGMSGFELLSVVRRRFPSVQAIAMSGAFSGDEVPSGVAAHCFYQKGSSVGSLIKMMNALPRQDRSAASHTTESEPIWIQLSGAGNSDRSDNSDQTTVTISCPECLRSFSSPCSDVNSGEVHTAQCAHCKGLIRYSLVDPIIEKAKQARESGRGRFEGSLQPSVTPPFSC
ncbi:MAG: response regulator [Terracidiphilus sp.]|jgi:CheY-like chemotaxis protein